MCLILFAIDEVPDYPLVVVANRDEFFQRPTLGLHAWENSPIIAGKDLSGGGTWMGITTDGRFAALTNFRDPRESVSDPLSRGLLVRDFLESSQDAPDYLASIARDSHRYPGFNLIVGQTNSLWYFSNKSGLDPEPIPAGIHGLSNHLLNTPWPKVTTGKQSLQQAIQRNSRNERTPDTAPLFNLMNQRDPAPDDQLPDTGVGRDFERVLSSRFIQAPLMNYGTRCSTVLMLSHSRPHRLEEKTWDQKGSESDHVRLAI